MRGLVSSWWLLKRVHILQSLLSCRVAKCRCVQYLYLFLPPGVARHGLFYLAHGFDSCNCSIRLSLFIISSEKTTDPISRSACCLLLSLAAIRGVLFACFWFWWSCPGSILLGGGWAVQMPSGWFLTWFGPVRTGEQSECVDLTASSSASGVCSGGAAEGEWPRGCCQPRFRSL